MTIIVNGSNTPTAGAVGYGDGTNLAFTSAGTTGQFLSSNGSSAPSWVGAPASAMTLISTLTASSSASLAWTGLSGYDKYQIIFENFIPTSSNSFIFCILGTGATPTYITSSYSLSNVGQYAGNLYGDYSGSKSGFVVCGDAVGITSASPQGGSGTILLSGLNGTTGTNNCSGIGNYFNSSNGDYPIECFGSFLTNSTPVTAIKLQFQGGNIASGKASLYGITS